MKKRLMQGHRPLPFQVRNTKDLERAVAHVTKNGDTEANRRYVIARAKALGHTDMVPSSWMSSATSMADVPLEKHFQEHSARLGVSVARLKCVYFRGIEEFRSKEMEFGSPSMWGFLRVQKYLNALKAGDLSTCDDSDLQPGVREQTVEPETGIELFVDSNVVTDITFGNMDEIAHMFYPGTVYAAWVDDSSVYVEGSIGHDKWLYTLDLPTGLHNISFTMSDTVALVP